MKARITVTLKHGILDPQGNAIQAALDNMDMPEIESVRQGKVFDVEISESDPVKAKKMLEQACERLLANITTEDYDVTIEQEQKGDKEK